MDLKNFFPKSNTLQGLLTNIGLIFVAAFILLYIVFYVILPKITLHGEVITVPNVTLKSVDELEEELTTRNLEYEIKADSDYNKNFPAEVVLKQYPEAGTKVKKGRVVSLTLNASHPPEITMPKLIDSGVKSAMRELKSYGLEVGEIIYEPGMANLVLDQQVKGKTIQPGTKIYKGTAIDLVVGDQGAPLDNPNIKGLNYFEAETILLGSGLKIGEVFQQSIPADSAGPGTVLRQMPPSGQKVYTGTTIDLWIVEIDSATIEEMKIMNSGQNLDDGSGNDQ
ncbi:PASTA domain-containing protein [Marinigracilibium pacificum]|uniref:PASTA domain-containing protein n=1 Tax=Marinigracilibium pacificum TaxID=2729599 RepID=A0A848IYE4_9BACT|nr:PASTA domain-containing protein [Marinigracilibium pacificum]NMM49297.1 PASTA domain-containing protein [Marinigracilibium pacificum]